MSILSLRFARNLQRNYIIQLIYHSDLDFDDETSDFTHKISRKLEMIFEDFPHDCLIYNEMMADIINGRAEGLDHADPTLLITLVINLLPIASINH